MSFVIGLIFGAAILGVIIVIMDEGDFPGWGVLMLCVLAAVVPAAIINALLPPNLFFIGLAIGTVSGGFAISALCGMTVKRASIAVGIYFLIQIAISLCLSALAPS